MAEGERRRAKGKRRKAEDKSFFRDFSMMTDACYLPAGFKILVIFVGQIHCYAGH